MRRNSYWMMAIVPAVCAALGGAAISAQDKYTVQVPGESLVLRVQGIRGLAGRLHQQDRSRVRAHPRQSGDDRGLSFRHSRQRQAFPRRLEDRQGPLQAGEER